MARRKVKLQYIQSDSARRVTYKKRVKGLLKKTQELSVLCDVDACAIVYGPYDPAPVVWPSCEAQTRRILTEFRRKPEIDQCQRRFDQQAYLTQSVAKAEEKLAKLQRRNREMEMENIMSELLHGKPIEQVPFNDLADLLWVIDDKLRSVQHRIRILDAAGHPPNPSANAIFNPNLIPGNQLGPEMMGGINTLMAETAVPAPWEMQAGPSQPHFQ